MLKIALKLFKNYNKDPLPLSSFDVSVVFLSISLSTFSIAFVFIDSFEELIFCRFVATGVVRVFPYHFNLMLLFYTP